MYLVYEIYQEIPDFLSGKPLGSHQGIPYVPSGKPLETHQEIPYVPIRRQYSKTIVEMFPLGETVYSFRD